MREVAQQRGRGGCRIFTQNAHFSRGYASIFQTNPNSVAQGAIENYAVIQCITRIL
jgi:acyl-CoA hydrolase